VIHAPSLNPTWILAAVVAAIAAITDWRSRRIPNWLTVSGAAAGIAANTIFYRSSGLKAALLGMGLGLALLLPFVLIRSLGAGDWKLAGALGACLGPRPLIDVLIAAILVAGVMALAVVIHTGRLKKTLLNIAHIVGTLFTLRLPGAEVSLDNPQSTKIPFGVALALATILYVVAASLGKI
jgi:prepilin peptidase CpaA